MVQENKISEEQKSFRFTAEDAKSRMNKGDLIPFCREQFVRENLKI